MGILLITFEGVFEMNYSFGYRSKIALSTAHPLLIRLFNEVIKIYDCSVLYGHRTEKEQAEMVRLGFSRLVFPNSEHNKVPSLAVDVVPYPIDWNDKNRFFFLSGIVKGIASQLSIKIRWGGDWDSDNDFKDQTWIDLPHYELVIK
jgi:peptidoglycan L-alanyl-D-glutamate endopeptidase CwlK